MIIKKIIEFPRIIMMLRIASSVDTIMLGFCNYYCCLMNIVEESLRLPNNHYDVHYNVTFDCNNYIWFWKYFDFLNTKIIVNLKYSELIRFEYEFSWFLSGLY